jgi:hypothetical protein
MHWWYLYFVGGSPLALVAFVHIDEHVRHRKHRVSMETIEALPRKLVGASSLRNDFTSVRSYDAKKQS